IYRRISTYIRLQLTILSSVLQLMVYATILNINGGVALFPLQLLFCKFFVVITVVVGFIVDAPDPGVMQRPPRKPGTNIVTRPGLDRRARPVPPRPRRSRRRQGYSAAASEQGPSHSRRGAESRPGQHLTKRRRKT